MYLSSLMYLSCMKILADRILLHIMGEFYKIYCLKNCVPEVSEVHFGNATDQVYNDKSMYTVSIKTS
jgi:hypothetical protein